MILHLYKNNSPKTSFKENSNWSCDLISFIARFDRIQRSGIYMIETDLIRRESNTNRVLFNCFLEKGSTFIEFTPTHPLQYKLRLHDVSSSVFDLRHVDNTQINLIDFSATFDIKETYARF